MKTKLFGCFLFLLPSILCAQTSTNYSVKGILLDSLTKEPIPYATIHIVRKENPEKSIKMLVTDTKGKFKEQLQAEGIYCIALSSVGNQTVEKEFTINNNNKEIDLGVLFTSEAVEELGGITVTARKPLVKAEVDKITYDVESDPDAEAKTVLDMLRKVPLVIVDGEDNIKLNGKSNFKIYLNGRPSNMLSSNPGKTLKSIPATTVKNIAVITNPGAKYDAEGVGGIIDIITVNGNGMEGYTATFNAGGNTLGGWHAGINTVFQVGKISVSGNYNYYEWKTNIPSNQINTEYFGNTQFYKYSGNSSTKYKSPMHFGSIEASYEIDTLNLLTFTFSSSKGNSTVHSDQHAEMSNAAGQQQYAYNIYKKSHDNWGGLEVSANYQRTLSKKEELLTISYRYNHAPSGGDSYQRYDNKINAVYPDQRTDNVAATNEHTAQVDYVNLFFEQHSLETGVKYIFRDNYSDSKYEEYNIEENIWKPVIHDLSAFNHYQHILSTYAAYTLKYKKFGLKAGARLEHSRLKVKLHSDTQPDFDKNYTDIIPNGNISYQLSDTKTLRATYNLRIARPGIWYLNPYRNTKEPHIIKYGNTNLKTEKYHNTEITFSSFAQALMINTSIYHSFSNNSIQQYSLLGDNNVMEYTYGNIGKQHSVGLNLYTNVNIGTKTSIWLNANVGYTDLRSKLLDEQADGWNGECSVGFQQQLPWKLKLGGYGGYYGPSVQLQGKSMSYYYYGLYLNRSFLKDERLTISLSGNSPFNKNIKFNYTTETKDFRTDFAQKQEQRQLSINISYRLGDLKASVKKISRGIINDDVKNGGSNSKQGNKN